MAISLAIWGMKEGPRVVVTFGGMEAAQREGDEEGGGEGRSLSAWRNPPQTSPPPEKFPGSRQMREGCKYKRTDWRPVGKVGGSCK
mmetsp:Transcript_33406/g.68203  ORF Transcript_33406/g.68203 Transcript_33406/m.68203 type:complete len:86 (+) Transcript_33406:65-322(+)